jgi:hypothetical protein
MRRSTAHSRFRFLLSLTISIITCAFNVAIATFAALIYLGVR